MRPWLPSLGALHKNARPFYLPLHPWITMSPRRLQGLFIPQWVEVHAEIQLAKVLKVSEDGKQRHIQDVYITSFKAQEKLQNRGQEKKNVRAWGREVCHQKMSLRRGMAIAFISSVQLWFHAQDPHKTVNTSSRMERRSWGPTSPWGTISSYGCWRMDYHFIQGCSPLISCPWSSK